MTSAFEQIPPTALYQGGAMGDLAGVTAKPGQAGTKPDESPSKYRMANHE